MRRALLALSAASLWLTTALPPARADPSLEYAVKAAYLVKFTPFIAWPDSAFAAPNAPLTICVDGADPFGVALDKAAAGQKAGDHPIVVQRIAAFDPAAPCQLLFLGAMDPAAAAGALAALKNRPVVTVTNSGVPARGIIGFVIEGNHVRFDIDNGAAQDANIQISSKLLDLAHAVRQKAVFP